MNAFIKVAKASEIRSGHGKRIKTGTCEVAIFNADGAFYAIENRCLFCDGSLSEGTLEGTLVSCPFDDAKFYLPTGQLIYPPSEKHVSTYRLRIEKDEIIIHPGRRNESEVWEAQDAEIPAA